MAQHEHMLSCSALARAERAAARAEAAAAALEGRAPTAAALTSEPPKAKPVPGAVFPVGWSTGWSARSIPDDSERCACACGIACAKQDSMCSCCATTCPRAG